MKKPRVLVLFGDGINCERETAFAFESSGCEAKIVHINELLETPKELKSFDAMAIPGGFSFGDELGSGKLMALKIKHGLMSEFEEFVKAKKPIIGICNGFQVLMKLDLLPSEEIGRNITLTENVSGNFINKWSKLRVEENTKCKWLDKKSLSTLKLPIRHGEGNIRSSFGKEDEIIQTLESGGNIVLRYEEDENGSLGKIAGICDDEGLIFGLMPHPEAAFFNGTSFEGKKDAMEKNVGAHFFETITKYMIEGNTHER